MQNILEHNILLLLFLQNRWYMQSTSYMAFRIRIISRSLRVVLIRKKCIEYFCFFFNHHFLVMQFYNNLNNLLSWWLILKNSNFKNQRAWLPSYSNILKTSTTNKQTKLMGKLSYPTHNIWHLYILLAKSLKDDAHNQNVVFLR